MSKPSDGVSFPSWWLIVIAAIGVFLLWWIANDTPYNHERSKNIQWDVVYSKDTDTCFQIGEETVMIDNVPHRRTVVSAEIDC